jgi:hypothetical protein
MVLTKEERVELLAKARLAKANKRASMKEAETEDEDEHINVKVELPEPEPVEPVPKKKTGRKPKEVAPVPVEVVNEPKEPEPILKKKVVPNPKWLKNPKTEPEKVCCSEKVSKEEYLIDDEKPQLVAEKIVIPSKAVIKKPRLPRASTKTLDLTPPRDIEEVLEDVKNNNQKYLQKIKQATPTPTAPISFIHEKMRLFDY